MYDNGVYHLFYQYNPYGAVFGDSMIWAHSVSYDLINWIHLNQAIEPSEPFDINSCWSDFYPVFINSTNGVDTSVHNPSVKYALKASFKINWHDCYVLGTYDPEKENFAPDNDFTGTNSDLRFDYGKFYASKTFFDPAKNRRILWAWVNESDSTEDDIEKGWAGLQVIWFDVWKSKPLQANFNGSRNCGLLEFSAFQNMELANPWATIITRNSEVDQFLKFPGITASQADVEVSFELPELESAELIDPTRIDPQLICSEENASRHGMIGPFGLLVLASKNLEEQTAIFFRIFKGHNKYIGLICSDQSRTSLRNELDKTTYGAFFDIDSSHLRTISLRSLIDHSIVESFGEEGRIVITSSPLLAIEKEAHLYAFNNGTLRVGISKLNAWCMKKSQFDHEGSLNRCSA
ncbi:Beta-fructofuranosidase, insoluble isoenzyme like [Quillaja saponaria]|uniref:Beta-fructofuranosidase, insoluble isoenzyme like n=1 Tax=Quillaja saponaria TaxID=32244 RepID=A0AAD7LHW5_QUISA|nr:Beta-fructofuranosidase, insoluble isoenzyme like [Quillaja saponaria]